MHAHLCHPTSDGPARASQALQARGWGLLAPVPGHRGLLVTLWPDEAGARQAAASSGAGRVLEVEDVLGHDCSRVARYAGLTEFDGPRSAAQVEADRRSNRERVGPAALQVTGVLGALVLRAPDGAMVVVALAEHEAALVAASHAIVSTPLLPGEDPALLRGPDRHTTHPVQDGGLTALVTRVSAAAAR